MGSKRLVPRLLLFCGISSLIHSVSSQIEDLSDAGHHVVKRQIDNRRVVCYYANWAVYRQGTAKFTPQNINPYLCTHLIYAFAGLGKDDTIQTFDKYQDLEKGGYGQFAALKTYNRDLKTLIAIGGWNEGSKRFSPLVADPKRRKTFIKSAIRFLRQYNFDGLDLDWEYPTFRDGGKKEDRINYAKFVTEMREAFEEESFDTGKPRLMITMAVPASLEYAGKGFDIATLDKHLDFFNLLTYDYHSAYEPATNHHSPLYRPGDWSDFDFRADLNIDATIQFYIKSGASRDKLVLGIPTYGRSYTLVNNDAHEIGSPTDGPGEAGKGTKEDGYLAYYEICQAVQDEDGWDVETPYPGVMGPYAHKDKLWVGFDDEFIVREKAHFVVEENLGGIMFWTIDNDDFRSACGDRPFPLIESAKEALYGKDAAIRTATSVSISTSEQTRVERLKLTRKQLAELASRTKTTSITPKPNSATTPFQFDPQPFDPFSTPEPPTTPSSAPAYTCKDEGFFPHTTSCKKYFWCLDVPGSGMVAHTFTCPQGLYFNSLTDGCDFRRNVDCEGKDEKEEEEEAPASTTAKTTVAKPSKSGEPETLEDVLEAIKSAGGLEAFEEKLQREEEEREAAKRREEERRAEISKKTRSRLSELLDRKRAEVLQELERNGVVTETEPTKVELFGFEDSDGTEEPITLRPNRFRPEAGIRNRLRNRLHEVLEEEALDEDSEENDDRTVSRPQNTRPNIASIRQRNPAFSSAASAPTTERTITTDSDRNVIPNRGLPPSALEEENSNSETTSSTPRTLEYVTIDRGSATRAGNNNQFVTPLPISQEPQEKAKDVKEDSERPRSGLQTSIRDLEYVTIQRGNRPSSTKEENDFRGNSKQAAEEESVSGDQFKVTTFKITPAVPESTTTSPNLRASLLFLTNPNLAIDDDEEDDLKEDEIVALPKTSTSSPSRFTSPSPIRTTPRPRLRVTTTADFRPLPAIIPQPEPEPITFVRQREREREREPAVLTTANPGLEAFKSLEPVRETTEKLSPEEELFNSVFQTQFDENVVSRPRTDPLLNRRKPLPPRRPTNIRPSSPSRPSRPESPRRLEPVSRPNTPPTPIKELPRRPQLPVDPVRHSNRGRQKQQQPIVTPSVTPVTPNVRPVTPRTDSVTPNINRGRQQQVIPQTPRSNPLINPITTETSTSFPPPVTVSQFTIPASASPVPQSQPIVQPVQPISRPRIPVRPSPSGTPAPVRTPDFNNYEYDYNYDDAYDSSPALVPAIGDYDLNPLTSKVQILDNGKPVCQDVGVFPHPGSCRKFITCSRRAVGSGIVGWVYECPSYLAFDPVGGRCNWANEFVCAERRY